MENDLLDDLNRLPFTQQKEAFYSAYSKYIIVDTDTMLIAFHSTGITDLFSQRSYTVSPYTQTRERVSGQDIFKFLGYHTTSGLPRDYKSRVKQALKSSMAITLDVSLATQRALGVSERFASHWTPLKNEFNAVGFVVVTLCSEFDRANRAV